MRIVMLCRLYSPHLGGVEKHVEEITKVATEQGNRVDIFTLKHDESLPSYEKKDGVHIHRKPTSLLSRLLKYVAPAKIVERDELWGWMLWNLPTFLSADVIHIHDVFFWYWPIRILLPQKKVYITFHGFEAGSLPTAKAKQARQRAALWTRGNMAVGGWIEKWYGTKADIVTYGAGNCSRPHHKVEKQAHLVDAVFLGRLENDTGVLQYANTVKTHQHVQLDIYGAGTLKQALRALQRETRNIQVKGSTDDSCMVLSFYDIACVSSYLSILEAMQSQVLVVAFATDELKWDYLQSHPRASDMVIVRSAEELNTFFTEYTKEKYEQHVERAYAWARHQTWDHLYQEYKQLWNI